MRKLWEKWVQRPVRNTFISETDLKSIHFDNRLEGQMIDLPDLVGPGPISNQLYKESDLT